MHTNVSLQISEPPESPLHAPVPAMAFAHTWDIGVTRGRMPPKSSNWRLQMLLGTIGDIRCCRWFGCGASAKITLWCSYSMKFSFSIFRIGGRRYLGTSRTRITKLPKTVIVRSPKPVFYETVIPSMGIPKDGPGGPWTSKFLGNYILSQQNQW